VAETRGVGGGQPTSPGPLSSQTRPVEGEQRLLLALERINRLILAAPSIDSMLTDVLDALLALFECDRAWLLFPCDPDAEAFTVPMERTRPEWPGAGVTGERVPMNEFSRLALRASLLSPSACRWDGIHNSEPLTGEMVTHFTIRSMMHMAIHPRSGPPWCLGIHHWRRCSRPSVRASPTV
jgi:hypothetical protein